MRIRMLLAACAAVVCLVPATAGAQDYPSKTVKIIVPFPPGNSTDIVARLIADKLSASLKQTFIVENHGGGNAVVGAAIVARAPADGYTIMIGTNSVQSAAPYLTKDLPFDPIKDLVPVAMIVEIGEMLVVPSTSKANSVDDLIAMAKKNPGTIKVATSNTIGQFAAEQFKLAAGIDLVGVPYKATQQALNDLSTGQVDLMFNGAGTNLPYFQNKTIKALVTTSKTRMPNYPDLPIMAEKYPGFEASAWIAVSAPANVPQAVIEKLNSEVNKALALPDVKAKMATFSYDIKPMTPAETKAYIDADIKRWGEVTKAANWKAE